jgi:hypothetical protein
MPGGTLVKSDDARNPSAPKARATAPIRRFKIERLEERIAPKKGSKGTHNCTANCVSVSGGGSGY